MADYEFHRSSPARFHPLTLILLFLGVALSLSANIYQFVRGERTARDLALTQNKLQAQITRLSDATSGAFSVTEKRFVDMKKAEDATSSRLNKALSQSKRSSQVAGRLEDRNQKLERRNRELVAQLTELKQEINAKLQKAEISAQSTNSRLDAASAKLDQLARQTEKNRGELKPTAAAIPPPVPAVPAPRRPIVLSRDVGQPAHFEFDLLKTKVPTRVAGMQVAVRSADPKTNRCTLDLYDGDRIVETVDRTVNQPVQLYLHGSQSPREIVVREIRKDEVLGYISVPKPAGIQTAASAGRKDTPVSGPDPH